MLDFITYSDRFSTHVEIENDCVLFAIFFPIDVWFSLLLFFCATIKNTNANNSNPFCEPNKLGWIKFEWVLHQTDIFTPKPKNDF